MYYITEIILIVFCFIIIIFGIRGILVQNKYKKDTETVKKIIEYFEEEGKDGIEPKNISNEIIKTGYIPWMLKDKTLVFENNKYYLNKR